MTITPRPRLLLVEDSTTWQQFTWYHLPCYDIVTVSTREEGIEKLNAESWDVLILDLNLLDSLGWETMIEIRKRTKPIPTLIVSTRPEDAESGLALRFVGKDELADNPEKFREYVEAVRTYKTTVE